MAAPLAVGFAIAGRNLRHFRIGQNVKIRLSCVNRWFCVHAVVYQNDRILNSQSGRNFDYVCSKHVRKSKNVRWMSLGSPSENEEFNRKTMQNVDPFTLAKPHVAAVMYEIEKGLSTEQPELRKLSSYYFDGHGKFIRPTIAILMAQAINNNNKYEISDYKNKPLPVQLKVAAVAEMIHTATLVHDDVIDLSYTRRGKDSVNKIWGQRMAILGGDFILSSAADIVAKIKNHKVTSIFAEILIDLVQGELMQLGSAERENERFSRYLLKTYKKTASLIANSCKTVALLGKADDNQQQLAYQYGKNVGLAFQLIDDVLDFESSSSVLGKPATADLRLGLATAPVLFACEKFPELNSMIMRRFNQPGDVDKALDAVLKSDGIVETRRLAQKHCNEAVKLAKKLTTCLEQQALCTIPDIVLNRVK